MEYIVKDANQEQVSPFKDFYITEKMKDINGNDVQVPKFVGTYSQAQLLNEAQMIDNQIEALNAQKVDILEKLSMF